jgi:hypothetical protein
MNEFEFPFPPWDESRRGGPHDDLFEDEAPVRLFEPTIESAIIVAVSQSVPLPAPPCPLGRKCALYGNGLQPPRP